MQAPPPLLVCLRRFGQWQAMCLGLAGGSTLVCLAWWGRAWERLPPEIMTSVAIFSAAVLLSVVGMAGCRACDLRWDGQHWHFIDVSNGRTADPRVGRLEVACDLGFLLLLQWFEEGLANSPRRAWPWQGVWLPVQRRGHEMFWHALRCTVYSSRSRVDRPVDAGRTGRQGQ